MGSTLLLIGLVVEMSGPAEPRFRVCSFDDGSYVALSTTPSAHGLSDDRLIRMDDRKGRCILAIGSSVGEHAGVRYLWSARLLQVLDPAEAIRTWIAWSGVMPASRPKLPAIDQTVA